MRETDKKILKAYAEYLFKGDIFKIDKEFPVSQIYVNLDFEKKVKPQKQIRPELEESQGHIRKHRQHPPAEPKVVSIEEVLKAPMALVLGKPGSGKTTTLKFIAVQHLIALIRKWNIPVAEMEQFQNSRVSINIVEPYLPIFIHLPDNPSGIKDLYELAEEKFRGSIGRDVKQVGQVFEKFWNDGKVLILIDSFDETSARIQQETIEALIKSYGTKPKVLLAMRDWAFEAESDKFWNIFSDVFSILPLQLQDKFISRWVKALSFHKKDEEVQKFVNDFKDGLDRLESRRPSLRKSLENPLLLKITIELVVHEGVKLLDKVNSRAGLYREYTKKLVDRGFERLSEIGLELTGEEREDWEKLIHQSFKEIAVERMTTGELTIKHLLNLPGIKKLTDKLEKKLSKEKLDALSEGTASGNPAIGFLCNHVGIVVSQVGTIEFMHKTFLEYAFSQWLLERWRENKKAAWRYLRRCLHSPDMREPILLLAGSLKGKELEDFIKKVMHSGSEYEFLFHRNLLMAGLIAGETGYNGRLRDEIISKMPGWMWAGIKIGRIWRWHPWGELWRDAVIAMGYPRNILSELVEALEDEDWHVREAAVRALAAELGIRDRDVVMKIIERLEDENSGVRWTAVRALGSLGIRDRDVVMKIVERLEDEDSWVRRAAVDALGSIYIKDTDVVMKIVEKLEHKYWGGRYEAVRALGLLGIRDRDVVMKLVERLEDEDSRVRRAAVRALGLLGIRDRDVVMKLVDRLEDWDSKVRKRAVRALGSLGIRDRDVVIKIVERLEDEDWDVRYAAMWALGSLGIRDRDVVMKIVEKLEHKYWRVRDAAVRALAELGIKDRDVVMKIVEKLEHKDSWVREAAVRALAAELGIRDRDVVMKIIERLEDEEAYVRKTAVEALGKLGIRDRDVVMKIVERLEDEDSRARETVVRALGKLGIRDRNVAMKIIERLEDEDWRVREAAVDALGKLGIKDKDVAMKIVEKLEHANPNVRYAVVRVLCSLGIKDKDVVMKIVERLEDKESYVREAAVEALGSLGIKDKDVAMKIVEELEHEDWLVREEAVRALGSLGIKDKDVVMKIVERLEDKESWVRRAAVEALCSLGIKDKDVVMKIVERLKDRNSNVRYAAVGVLGWLGIRDRAVVMKLVERLEDEDSRVRRAAVRALGSLGIKDRDVAMKIVEKLEHKDSNVRWAAVRALGSLGIRDRDVVMKIVENLEDEDSDVRRAAVEALGSLGIRDRDVVMKIVERLEDEDSGVREAAVWALGLLGIKDKNIVMEIIDKLEDEDSDVRDAAAKALGELSDEPEVIEKTIKKYAGPGWKQKLDYKLPYSKLGEFIREILKIKQVELEALYPLLHKLTVFRCQESVEAFIGWWKFKTAVLEACPQCKTFWNTVIKGMFDFKGADLLVESLSLVVAAWNPLLKIFPFLPKLASAFLSLILSFLAIAFLLNAFPLAYKCHISCPREVKKQQTASV